MESHYGSPEEKAAIYEQKASFFYLSVLTVYLKILYALFNERSYLGLADAQTETV